MSNRLPWSILALSLLLATACFKDTESGDQGDGTGDGSESGDGATSTEGDDDGATDSGTTGPDDTTDAGGTGSGGTTGPGTTGAGSTGVTDTTDATDITDTTESATETTTDTTTTGGGEVVLFELWNFTCNVDWLAAPDTQTGATPVVCNAADQGQGAAQQLVSATIETNETVDQAILLVPWRSAEGVISGVFTDLNLTGTTKPMFRARVACSEDAPSCDVQWQMWARPAGGGGMPPVLENGFESFDGSVTDLDIDLSLLKEPIDLALSVTANGGASSEDVAVFENPRIVEE